MENKKKRRVMVGTPCYDGSIDVWYVNSLVNTVKMAEALNVEIIPIWVSYDALVQRARNDTIALVRELDCDDIIFIDNDIEWEPEWFYRLLNYPVDIVGGTYPKKGEAELYVAKMDDPYAAKDPVTNLLEVDGLGTGFLRFSRRAVDAIWDDSPVYVELDQQKDRRWVFEVVVENGGLISEDIHLCRKLKKLGFKTWLDTSITCNHIGFKKYTGNFDAWLAKTRPTASVPKLAPTVPVPPSTQPSVNTGASRPSYGNNYLNRYVNNKGIS